MKAKPHIMIVFTKIPLFDKINVVFNRKHRRFKDLNKLASLQNQVQTVRLEDNLAKQNFHEDMGKN